MMILRRCAFLVWLVLALAGMPAVAAVPADALLGAWKLVGIDYASAKGPAADTVFGPNPTGLIIYDRSGWMSVQIAMGNRPHMPAPASRTYGVATPEQAQLNTAAFNTYYGYFGKWDFDPGTGTVVHHLESSLLPWETGRVYKREARIQNDTLTLVVRTAVDGVDYTRTLVWRRAPAGSTRR